MKNNEKMKVYSYKYKNLIGFKLLTKTIIVLSENSEIDSPEKLQDENAETVKGRYINTTG